MIPVILAALGAAAPLVQIGFEAMRQIAPALAPAIGEALAGKVAPKAMAVLTAAGRIVGKVATAVEGDPALPGWSPQVIKAVKEVGAIAAPVIDHIAQHSPDAGPDIADALGAALLTKLAEAEARADAASQALADAIKRRQAPPAA